jgi:hypothetical protein
MGSSLQGATVRFALLAAVLALIALPSGASAVVQTAGNGFYNVHVEDSGNQIGRYTATTGPSHPQGPDLNVLFGDGDPGTTFDSVRSFTTSTDYTQGDGGTSLAPFGSVTPLGSTGFRTTYTLPGPAGTPDAMTIVQDFFVVGTTFEDSRVIRETSITNTGGGPLSAGVRYLWDFQIGEDDGPTFQQLTPDGDVLVSEADFGTPGFETYRIVDNDGNPSPPTFAVLGTSTGPTTLSPQPTPPTLLKYASWPSSIGTAFDYSTSGQDVADEPINDSAVLYWWGHDSGSGLNIGPGETVSVNAQMILTTPTGTFPAPQPEQPAAGPPLTFDISGRKNQKIAGPQVKPANNKAKNANRKLVSVKVTCQNKPCTADIKGTATVAGEKVKLKGPQVSLQPGETKRVRLSAKKPQLAQVKAALKAGEKGKVKVNGTATASDGEKAQDGFKVKLRG